VYSSCLKLSLHIRFPHAFTALRCIFYNLPWFCSIKVSYKKSQRNSENARGNRMCKLSLTPHSKRPIFFIFFNEFEEIWNGKRMFQTTWSFFISSAGFKKCLKLILTAVPNWKAIQIVKKNFFPISLFDHVPTEKVVNFELGNFENLASKKCLKTA